MSSPADQLDLEKPPFWTPALEQTAPHPGYGVQFDLKLSRDAALGGGPQATGRMGPLPAHPSPLTPSSGCQNHYVQRAR